jgi:hypothetical protein
MAPGTDLGLDSRFFGFGRLMVLMAGDAVDPVLGVLAIDPGQKDATSLLLMAGQTLPDLFFCPSRREDEGQKKDGSNYHSFCHGVPRLFLLLF